MTGEEEEDYLRFPENIFLLFRMIIQTQTEYFIRTVYTSVPFTPVLL